MSFIPKEFGIIVSLNALGTRQRIIENIDSFLIDWDLVLNRLEENVKRLDNQLSGYGYRTRIRTKDIFDNIQIFYPMNNMNKEDVDLTRGNNNSNSNNSNPISWWSLQYCAELLINLIRYAITKNIFLRGYMNIGYIQEYRNGYYSKAMVEDADLAVSMDMIGVIAGLCAMKVLNNKGSSSSSSPMLHHHFVKYRIPIKEPTRNRRSEFDRLAVLNLARQSKTYSNIDDKEIEKTIQQQIQTHNNNQKLRKKWENTKNFIGFISMSRDENNLL